MLATETPVPTRVSTIAAAGFPDVTVNCACVLSPSNNIKAVHR